MERNRMSEDLPAVDTTSEAGADHPDMVTYEEAEQGHRMYLAVDDLNDQSNGLGS